MGVFSKTRRSQLYRSDLGPINLAAVLRNSLKVSSAGQTKSGALLVHELGSLMGSWDCRFIRCLLEKELRVMHKANAPKPDLVFSHQIAHCFPKAIIDERVDVINVGISTGCSYSVKLRGEYGTSDRRTRANSRGPNIPILLTNINIMQEFARSEIAVATGSFGYGAWGR